MYAIIEACGRQYKVQEGETVYFEKLDAEEGKKVSFDKVVMLSNDGKVEVGNPYVANAKVEGKVVAHGRGKKVLVFKYKAKKNERKTRGHRQDYTKVEITSISAKAAKAEKAEKEEKVEKVEKEEKATKTTKTTAKTEKATKTTTTKTTKTTKTEKASK